MRKYRLHLESLTRVTVLFGLPCLLMSSFIMSPLWTAQFHPVDDHEFAAMLSYDHGSMLNRLYTRFFEMSPAGGYPESIHWRPAVWLARALETEFFGDKVALYFLWRTGLLAALGLLAIGYFHAVNNLYRTPQRSRVNRTLTPVLFGLLIISTPSLFDVFGRLLPGEMYTLLGLLAWAFAWTHLVNRRILAVAPELRYAVCAWLGMILMAAGKEDALFLWPLAFGLSLPEIRYFASLKSWRMTWGLALVPGLLWVAAMIQALYTFVFRRNPLPYRTRSSSELGDILSVFERIDTLLLLLVFSSVVLGVLVGRRLQPGHGRLALFFTAILFLELLYVSTVPADAPRYGSVFTVSALLLLSLYGTFLYRRFNLQDARARWVGYASLVMLALLIQLGAAHQKGNNTLYRSIAKEWNTAVEEAIQIARSHNAEQILLVVDPPGPEEIGRWEKSLSFARFVRLRSNGQQDLFLSVMASAGANVSGPAKVGLEATSRLGARDAAGHIFQPRSELDDLVTLCILYSNSGRDFPDSYRCDALFRLSL